jgi:hypothetical protein
VVAAAGSVKGQAADSPRISAAGNPREALKTFYCWYYAQEKIAVLQQFFPLEFEITSESF